MSSTSPGSDRKRRLALTREESSRSDQVRSGIVTMRASEFLSEHLNGVAGVVVRARHVDAGEPRWFDQSVRDA